MKNADTMLCMLEDLQRYHSEHYMNSYSRCVNDLRKIKVVEERPDDPYFQTNVDWRIRCEVEMRHMQLNRHYVLTQFDELARKWEIYKSGRYRDAWYYDDLPCIEGYEEFE